MINRQGSDPQSESSPLLYLQNIQFNSVINKIDILKCYQQYYHNLLESSFGNSKKVWSNINTILGKTGKLSSTSIKLNGIVINEPEVIASSFNSYFKSIPTTLSNNINNNILTFKNYLIDQIPEAENFQPSSIP